MCRIRAALSESNPAFGGLCDFTRKFCIDLILKFDGPWGAKCAGRARYYKWANAQKHVKDEYVDAVWDAIASMDAPVDALASYVGLAPRTRQSGTSLNSQHASCGGNKTLKRALYTSCTSLLLGDNPYHDYYNKQRAKGKNHGQAIKAVARKRLKVVYAVMRDKKPYSPDLDMLSMHKKECSYA